MLNKFFKAMILKSVAKDVVRAGIKSHTRNSDVVKEKLGVSSIDEFMRMDYEDFQNRK